MTVIRPHTLAGLALLALTAASPTACAHAARPAATAKPAATAAPAQPFSEAPLPHYLVRRAGAAITVDGRLDEFDWAAAPQIDAFERILNYYGRVLRPTRARMLWDDSALYLAFACRDGDMWALYDQEDDPMWSEEVVEAFIDPDGDGKDYLELEVNPLNAEVDLHITSVSPEWISDIDWDIAGLRTAVQAYGTVNDSTDVDAGWTVEIAIPWTAFTPTIVGGGRPQIGDRWRLNLYRIERAAGAGVGAGLREARAKGQALRQRLEGLAEGDPAHAEVEAALEALRSAAEPLTQRDEEETEYTAWSPTFQRGFHHPQRFGVIEFAP